MPSRTSLPPYNRSLAGTLLAAREAVMAPIRPTLRDADVTEQQWRVLRVLSNQGPTEPTSLAQAALLFPPSVARILKELADRGLINREGHAKDRRRSIVTLTTRGESLIRQTSSRTLALYEEYTRRFGPERLEALLGELRDLIEVISPLADSTAEVGTDVAPPLEATAPAQGKVSPRSRRRAAAG